MDKIELELKTPENKTIEYRGNKIEIIPYLTFAQQVFLIDSYMTYYFDIPEKEIIISRPGYHYLEAECRLKNYVIQMCTNIDISKITNDIYVESELWDKICDEIVNYYDFDIRLKCVVDEVTKKIELDKSVGGIIDSLASRLEDFVSKLENLNPEEIKKAGEQGLELMKQLEQSSLLANPSDKIEVMEKSLPATTPAKKRVRRKKE